MPFSAQGGVPFTATLSHSRAARGLEPAVTRWLFDIRNQTSVCMGGQVTEAQGLGLSIVLYRLARLVRGALEVGTYYGCGSTLVIAKGLIDGRSGGRLCTVESDALIAEAAREVMMRHALPVDVLHGLASAAHMALPRDDLKAYLPDDPSTQLRPAMLGWYDSERAVAERLAASKQTGVIERLCRREGRPIELVFLDGGEMYGVADAHQVLRHCAHVRFLAMDDTSMFKHHTSVRELKTPGWGFELCLESPPNADRPGGWALFAADGDDAAACRDLVRRYSLHGGATAAYMRGRARNLPSSRHKGLTWQRPPRNSTRRNATSKCAQLRGNVFICQPAVNTPEPAVGYHREAHTAAQLPFSVDAHGHSPCPTPAAAARIHADVGRFVLGIAMGERQSMCFSDGASTGWA